MVSDHPIIATLVAAAVALQIAVFTTTIYLHRAAAHKALVMRPSVAFLYRLGVWLTTGIVPREWVAVHRKHHAFTDEAGDPHSPRLEGFWRVQLGNVFYYLREAHNEDTVEKYAKDMPPDVWDRLFFNRGNIGLLAGTGILCLAVGIVPGIAAMVLHGFLYVFVLSSSINGLCHVYGYKNFDNTAGNIRSLALITGGEGLHNNHHGRPGSARLSVRASEFDPAWAVIRTMSLLGLARLKGV